MKKNSSVSFFTLFSADHFRPEKLVKEIKTKSEHTNIKGIFWDRETQKKNMSLQTAHTVAKKTSN
jgi:hypothetical protein